MVEPSQRSWDFFGFDDLHFVGDRVADGLNLDSLYGVAKHLVLVDGVGLTDEDSVTGTVGKQIVIDIGAVKLEVADNRRVVEIDLFDSLNWNCWNNLGAATGAAHMDGDKDDECFFHKVKFFNCWTNYSSGQEP